MTKSNRTCVICKSNYYYCSRSCADSLGKPSWMASFCSDNCRNIYNATAKYNMKKNTAEEARKVLNTCDLSGKENFNTSTKKLIDEIYKATEIKEIQPLKIYTIQEEPVKQTDVLSTIEITDEMVNRAAAIVENLNKPTNYKKKKKKRKND